MRYAREEPVQHAQVTCPRISFTGRLAVSPHEQLRRPSFGELAGREVRWDQLIQKDRVYRQQYGESNHGKRPHLEVHFSAASADWCRLGSVQALLPLGTAAELSPQREYVRSIRSYTYIHPRICHRHTLDSAFVQLAEWYLGVQSDSIEVHGQIKDVILVHRRRRRCWLVLQESFRHFAARVRSRLLAQLEPLLVTLDCVLALAENCKRRDRFLVCWELTRVYVAYIAA